MSASPSSAGDGHRPREAARYLVFSASLRADSLNTKLAGLAAVTIEANGGNDLAFGIRIASMLPVTMSSRAASRWGRPADEVASFRMTRVRLRDTCPELLLRSILHRSGRPPRARALDSRARGHCVSAGPPKPTSCHRAARGSAKVLSFRAPARRGSSCQIHHSYGGVCG
jgi:hypothetical protein